MFGRARLWKRDASDAPEVPVPKTAVELHDEFLDALRVALDAALMLRVGDIGDETCAGLLHEALRAVCRIPPLASESHVEAMRNGVVAMQAIAEWCDSNDASASAHVAREASVAFLLAMARGIGACR